MAVLPTGIRLIASVACATVLMLPSIAFGQTADDDSVQASAEAGPGRQTLVNKAIAFDASESTVPSNSTVTEVLWDFGDGSRTTGATVTHEYAQSGSFSVELTISLELNNADGTLSTTEVSDSTEVRVYNRSLVIVADADTPTDQLNLFAQQAAEEQVLAIIIRPKSGGPDALTEIELTQALLSAKEELSRSTLLVTWTSGSLGANILSRFAQAIDQTSEFSLADVGFAEKGVVILSDQPFGALSRTAQATYDRLSPAYVLLSRPEALTLLPTGGTSEEVRRLVMESPLQTRLLGSFSSRAVTDLGATNFMSFGVNYLINGGVPISDIILVLSIPVIATILAFARQVIGIKSFGLITPTMTTLSFLALGLVTGLIVFVVVLLSGTFTRMVLKRWRLLYLPRMGLVLSNVSLAILVVLGISVANDQVTALSFSIFPALILTVLAEEFIAVQFTSGLKSALKITAWTLLLAVVCYFILSWQLLRTVLLSYPELILLALPINVVLGRFTGLRLTEYIRFRELLRYSK